ncbi:MAG: CD225/dispanin family protein [Muribaculaceae bacterium]|nr:CD225/dispanin family protein [Muribaculaceae bacterium]
MRQYWINFQGKQQGPLSIENLKLMGVDDSAYVWHSGLDDWVKITSVPELREMLENKSGADAPLAEAANLAQETYDDSEVPELPEDHEVPDLPPATPQTQNMNMPQNQGYYQHMNNGGRPMSYAQAPVDGEDTQKCPPTNLVWAIIFTLLCCTPLGIVGIIFAYLTKKNYRQGDYEKAKRYSDYGAWACILSAVLGLMSLPFSFMMMLQ